MLTVWKKIGRRPVVSWNFRMPSKMALVPGRWSELACERDVCQHWLESLSTINTLTILNTTSAVDARAISLSGSSSDAIAVFTPSCSRSFAFTGDRTGVVIVNVFTLGCFRRRLSTDPPT